MGNVKDILARQFWVFSIVAVIFLAPSSGLITLTIPDEPYGNVLSSMPDNPHIGKRTSDDNEHLALDATTIVHRIDPRLIAIADVALSRELVALSVLALPAQIRGPPAIGLS